MNKWEDYFKIVRVDADCRELATDAWIWDEDCKYELHDPNGTVVATYKDIKYAKKQAKYKFRKIMAKLEKILLA